MRRWALILGLLLVPVVAMGDDGSAGHVAARRVPVVSLPLDGSLSSGDTTATFTRASSTWCEQGDGQWAEATSGSPCFGAAGLFVSEARTNYAMDSLGVADPRGPLGGTGTETVGADSGPFAAYNEYVRYQTDPVALAGCSSVNF